MLYVVVDDGRFKGQIAGSKPISVFDVLMGKRYSFPIFKYLPQLPLKLRQEELIRWTPVANITQRSRRFFFSVSTSLLAFFFGWEPHQALI